jgi:hypothetical protein
LQYTFYYTESKRMSQNMEMQQNEDVEMDMEYDDVVLAVELKERIRSHALDLNTRIRKERGDLKKITVMRVKLARLQPNP